MLRCSTFALRRLALLMALALLPARAGLGAAEAEDLRILEEAAFRNAVQAVAPSVVRIETFGGQQRVGDVVFGNAPTTGLIISADGYIVSSAYNFAQRPASILVVLPSGKRAPAELVSRDTSRHLVLLKVEADAPLPVPQPVPRDQMRVGQWAVAVGRTYDQPTPNISVGILSALDRIWGKAVQTDANISPSNYGGPLIDLRGRVFGVLVPLSPDGEDELAGAEWYDSGIGFAVPLADLLERLPLFRDGDLHAGVLGVSLKGASPYESPIEVAACQPNSPAYQAGVRPGDHIVSCEGVEVQSAAQLRHVLGRSYAGDTVQLVLQRGDERIEVEVELVQELLPFELPFLGVLPQRGLSEDQVRVRYVYPGSGAADAGIEPDDRIMQWDGKQVQSVPELRLQIANQQAGSEVTAVVLRGEEQLEMKVQLAALPETVPRDVPPPIDADASTAPQQDAGPAAETGLIEVKIPEEPNQCGAYIPPRQGDLPRGLLVHLMLPGEANQQQLVEQWKTLCDQWQVILLMPQAQDPQQWMPTEVAFIEKAIDYVTDQYAVDDARIAVMGRQSAGAMAALVAFRAREQVRGLAVVDAPFPNRLSPPATDPVQRLAFYVVYSPGSAVAERVQKNVDALRERKHNVVLQELETGPRPLNDQDRETLIRWLDTLDRL